MMMSDDSVDEFHYSAEYLRRHLRALEDDEYRRRVIFAGFATPCASFKAARRRCRNSLAEHGYERAYYRLSRREYHHD